ncbi:hypothetical protein [Phaeodactylibacter xiamenensis]|uniref:hypothetical protein n=1 Tax=Phaeodactylibacter xiamenensis TaxID=1524460 RepID=UPI003BAD2545
MYNKLHKTQRQPSAFKPYGCWGRASRSAPAYPGEANGKCWQAIQKVQFVMHTPLYYSITAYFNPYKQEKMSLAELSSGSKLPMIFA